MSVETRAQDPSALSLLHRLKFLARDSALYGGAAAVTKAFVGLVTFPLLAGYFSVAQYGLIDYFMVLGHLILMFFIFGQDSAVARFFYEHEDEEYRRQLITQSLLLQLVVTVAVVPLLWMRVGNLVGPFAYAPESQRILKLVLLQMPFLVIVNFAQSVLVVTFRRASFLLLGLGSAAATLVLLLVAILVLRVPPEGVFLVFLVVQSAFGVVGLAMIRRWLVVPRGLRCLRELVPYAIPFGVIGCIAAFVPALERTLVRQLLGAHQLGIYAAATKVAMLMAMLVTAFQTAWGPFSLAIHKEDDAADTYNWVVRLFVLLICAAVLSLSALAQPVLNLLASGRYAGSAIIVFPLAMGLAIQATGWITEIGIGLSKKSYLGLLSYTSFLVGTYVAIRLLVPIYSILGVALGVMVGYALKASTSSWLAQRAHPLAWELGPVVAILATTVVIGLGGMWTTGAISGLTGSAVFAAGALGITLAGWIGLFTGHDRQRIVRTVRLLARR